MTSTDSGADGGNKALSRKVMDIMKEATGASDDDVKAMLQLCNGDVNLATERLVSERPFETVVNKKVKRKQNVEEKGRDQRDSRRSGTAAAARPRPRPEPRAPRGPLPSLPKSTAAHIPPPRSYEPKPAAESWGAASTAATAATDSWGGPQEDAGTTQDNWTAPETSTSTTAPSWGAKPAAAAPAASTGSWGAPAPAAAAASSWTGNFADRLKAGTAKPVAPPEPEPLPEEDLDEPPPIEEDTSAYSIPPAEPLEEEPYAAPSEPEPAPASPPPPAAASPPPAQEHNPWEPVPSPAPASPPLVSTPAPITPQPVDAPTPSLTPPASTDDLRLTFGNFSLGGQSNDFHSAFPGAFGTVSAPQQAARQVNDLLAGSRAAEEPKATYEYPAVTDAQVPQPAPQDHRATFAPQPPAPTRPVPTPSYPYTAVASHAPEPAAPAPQQQQPSPQQMSGFHRGFDLKSFAQAQQQQQPAATDYTRPYKASNDAFGAGFGPGSGADPSGFGAAPAATNNGYGSLSSSDAHSHSAPSAPPAPAVTVPDYTANMTAAAAPRYHQPAPPPAPVAPPPVQQQQQQQVQQQHQQQQPPAPPAASAPPTSYAASSEPGGAPSSLPAVPGMMLPQQMQYGNPTIPANMQYPNMQYQYPQYYHPTHSYMHYNPYSHYSQVGQAYPQGAAGFPPAAAANTTFTNPAQHAAAPRNFTLPFNAAPTSGAATTTSQGYGGQAYGQPAHQGFGMSTSSYEAASGYSKEKEQQSQYQQAAAATSAAAAAAAAAAGAGAAAAPGAAAASAPSYPNQSRDYYGGGGGQQQQQQHGNYGAQHGNVPYQYQQHYGSHGYQHSSGQGGQGGRQPSNYK